MRIERLSLEFFGHFTGKSFDFGKPRDGSDFHVIYGPNEAGKSTTMEAYLRLLYGFRPREPYAFQHQRQNLRVSGLLDIDGEARLFTRLPSRSGNLRGEADTVLPESAIAAHLGGLSLEDYRSLLCLDDDTIEKGGEDIAQAKGDIGRLLFSAAAGVADLNAVLDQARDEANTLYKKRSGATRVAELKRALAEVESGIREMDVTANAWRKLKEALQAAEQEETQARAARDTLRAQQTQIEAQRRALPNLAKFDRLVAEVADYADYPTHIDINSEALVSMMTEQGQARAELDRLDAHIAELRTAHAKLVVDEERLTLTKELDDLDALRSRMQTALLDLPRRQREHDEALAEMQRIARDLGAPEGCDATGLIIAPSDIAHLETLRDRMRDAITTRTTGAQELDAVQARIAEAQKAHQALVNSPPAQTGVTDLLRRFDADRLATEAASATQAIASADAALRDALGALTSGAQRFSALPSCPVDLSTATELAERHAALSEKIARSSEKLAQLDEDMAANRARMHHIADSTGGATDDAAQEARTRRNALWQAHRAALSAESADEFARAMEALDRIDAARLSHASELGELRKFGQDMAEDQARAAKTRAERDSLEAQAQEIETTAQEVMRAIGLPALSVASFADWVTRHAKASEAQRRRDMVTDQHRETLGRAEQLRAKLAPLVDLDSPRFDAALAAARQLAEVEREYLDRLRGAADRLTALRDESDDRQRAQAALEGAAEQAVAEWRAGVEALFGDTLPPDRLAEALGQLRDLREHDATRREAAHRIMAMQHDQQRFTDAMTAIGQRFAAVQPDPLETFRHLREIAEQAKADKARQMELASQLDKSAQRRAELVATLADIDRKVTALGAVFPATIDTSSLQALREATGTARHVIEKRRQIAELEAQILGDLSLPDIDAARALLGDATAPELEAQAQSLKADLDRAEERLSAATVARANAARDLDAVTGGAEIAEMVEKRSTLQLQIEETLLDYLQRDFGLRIAEEAIRRYRDKHRSDMMAATERAFAELTNGAYKALQTRPEGASEILLAIDANGTARQIGEMSKGTRFQLYLALRAAAYEQLAAQGVALPFFCDDVFETFDEDRTRAACRLMERIGRSGQAIYLTHHRHVVEIAREVCETQPVVHWIDRRE